MQFKLHFGRTLLQRCAWHLLVAPLLVISVGENAFCESSGETTNATSTSGELSLNKGIVLYEQGEYAEALTHFQMASADNPTAEKYVSLCRDRLPSEAQYVSYNSAVGCCDEIECCTGVDCGSMAGDGGASPKRWHMTILTGYQYDSNVTLEPEFTGLGSGRDIEDSSWLVAAFADYQLVQRDRWNVGLIGSAYTNQYFTANQFDAQDYMGGVYSNVLLTGNMMAGIRYEFHETLLDYTQFATQHRLVPNVTILEGDFGHLTAYYEMESQEFDNTPLIPAMDRSGDTNSVGVTQAIYTMDGQGRIFVGYRHERLSTDGTDFDRKTDMVTGRAECPLGERCVFDCEYRHFWDDYDNPNSLDFAGRARVDRRSEVRSGLQLILNEHVSVRGDYTFINSNSNTANLFNVGFFDYNRHLFSTQVIYDF